VNISRSAGKNAHAPTIASVDVPNAVVDRVHRDLLAGPSPRSEMVWFIMVLLVDCADARNELNVETIAVITPPS
jgi:hypothetical protein